MDDTDLKNPESPFNSINFGSGNGKDGRTESPPHWRNLLSDGFGGCGVILP